MVGDLIISGLTYLTGLSGLENLAQFGPEVSIANNKQLNTTAQLSANVPKDPSNFLSLTNVGVRSNPLLRDLNGLSLVNNVTGEEKPLIMAHHYSCLSRSAVYSEWRLSGRPVRV